MVFVTMRILKGNPVSLFIDSRITPQMKAEISRQYGFDQPAWVQYGYFLKNIATGSLGMSFLYQRPVKDLIRDGLKQSLWFGMFGLGLGGLISLLLLMGHNLPSRPGIKVFSHMVTSLFLGLPSFLLGIFLMQLFGFHLGLFPVFGSEDLFVKDQGFGAYFIDKIKHVFLPGLCLALALAARFTSFLQQEMESMEQQPYILSARGRGVSEVRIFWKHKMLGLLPTVFQLLGLYLPILVSGALVLEHLFGWAGMGSLVFEAVGARDYPLLLGCTFAITTVALAGYQAAEGSRKWVLRSKHNLQDEALYS